MTAAGRAARKATTWARALAGGRVAKKATAWAQSFAALSLPKKFTAWLQTLAVGRVAKEFIAWMQSLAVGSLPIENRRAPSGRFKAAIFVLFRKEELPYTNEWPGAQRAGSACNPSKNGFCRWFDTLGPNF